MLPEFYHLELSKVHNMWQSYLETEINHYMYFDACCSHIVGFKVLHHSSFINSGAHTQRTCVNTWRTICDTISMIEHFEHGNTIHNKQWNNARSRLQTPKTIYTWVYVYTITHSLLVSGVLWTSLQMVSQWSWPWGRSEESWVVWGEASGDPPCLEVDTPCGTEWG